MKRTTSLLSGACLLWPGLFSLISACSPSPVASSGEELLMVVGTYTGEGSTGIYTFRLHTGTGHWQALDSVSVDNPSFIAPGTDASMLYAVSENGNENDALNVLRIDRQTGNMTLLGSQLTRGEAPCYVSANARFAVTANYTGGSLSLFPLDEKGLVAPVDTLFHGATGGNDTIRQATPHVHCAHFSPDGRFLLATDFSSDRILRFRVNDSRPFLTGPEVAAQLEPGQGPRHITFSPDGSFAYLISELSGHIHAFRYDATTGSLERIQHLLADSVEARGSAHIQLSPDGCFLYASHRLQNDGISIFAVNRQQGTLSPVGYQRTGIHPRHFAITPDGRLLLVACRDSHRIEIYRRDRQTGELRPFASEIPLNKPVDILFIR